MNFFIGTLGTLAFFLLSACCVLNAALSVIFIFRKDPNKRADFFFAALLIAFAATAFHHILILQNAYYENPSLLFLPVYFTLSFGTALFFFVKCRLFPGYRFVGSDVKHFILPLGQLAYFLFLFLFTTVSYREEVGRKFYSPFYGGLEMAIYIGTFYLYLFGAYRYVHFGISRLRKNRKGGRPLYEAFVIRRMLRVLIILFWINSIYIATDFVMYELLRLNMHDFRGFTRFGDLSFAAMTGWVGLSGIQLLLRMPYQNSSELIFSVLKRVFRGRFGKV